MWYTHIVNKILIPILLLILLISSCSKETDYIRLNIIETSVTTTTEHTISTLTQEKTQTETVTSTTTQTVYTGKLEPFKSYQELRDWLDRIKPELEQAKQIDWICQDYAWWLVERAIDDCKLMIYYSLDPKGYKSLFGVEVETAHAITGTYINGYTYLIEPQTLQIFPDWSIK